MEEWRPVEGWPYEVSSLGRIRRSEPRRYRNSRPDGVLKPSLTRDGYLRVTLADSGVQRTALIHRMVCAAFHGSRPTPRHHAAHTNGDKSDNCSTNLRWATPEENERDKTYHRTAQIGSRHPGAKLREEDVVAIRAMVRTGRFTHREIADLFGVNKSKISHITTGISWRHVA